MAFKRILSSDKLVLSLLFLFLPVHISQAQFAAEPQKNPVEGTLRIIAVMAEFEPDTNRFTSGNGTFEPGSIPYLDEPGTPVDALPHNQAYFEAHLEFVKNYFEKISGSRLTIEYEVLPEIYRLPNQMQFYSPVGPNPELTPVADLARDLWQQVAGSGTLPIQLNPSSNPETAFVIFHAGIGRDVELTATTLDRTPQDIPSLYLDLNSISELLSDPTFSGFPISDGNILVTNSLIVPRTLTRAGTDFTGNRFLIPLSINGLLTAQIGSHIGLPDLFNTETGESGIGRFGLMDGAGIFAYNGLFPPELSAWEKLYLGWAQATDLEYDTSGPISVPAASLREENSIYRIPISRDEYFLAENRHRDPDGNGVTLTIRRPDGSVTNQTFTNQDADFTNQLSGFDRLLEPGVITNVSNYDFALPGFLDESENGSGESRELNGGILIWHIDESVIRGKINTNTINNNPDRRGIDLKEADGAQDIGRTVSLGLSENPVNGSPFDFWWDGNNSTVITQGGSFSLYENRFAPDTTPDNDSHTGGTSFFELFNFSDNLPVGSFEIQPVDPFSGFYSQTDSRSDLSVNTVMTGSDLYYRNYPLSVLPFNDIENPRFLIPGINGFQIYNPVSSSYDGPFVEISGIQQPLITFNSQVLAVAEKPELQTETVQLRTFNPFLISAVPDIDTSIPGNKGFISQSDPNILDIDGTPFRYNLNSNQLIEDEQAVLSRSASFGEYQSTISNGSLILRFPGGTEIFNLSSLNEQNRLHTGIINAGSEHIYFYLLTHNRLSLFTPEDNYSSPRILAESNDLEWPAIVDINHDGFPDFIYTDYEHNRIEGLNINGARLDGFPIAPINSIRFRGTPLIADLNGNGTQNLIITGEDSLSAALYAYDATGNQIDGFPLYLGAAENVNDVTVHPAISGHYLLGLSQNGDLKAWHFENIGEILWPSKYGTAPDNKVSGSINEQDRSPLVFSLLNKNETYNWPNPARDETIIRFQTDGPAEISLTISSMSGRKIYSEKLQSRGGLPEEHRIDTSGWASGAYFALLTAKQGRNSENKLINIAIVK